MSNTAPLGVIPEWTSADRLVKARQLAGLTQAQLAERLGVSEKTIKRYEATGNGKRGTLIGWGFTCGVDVKWLLGEPHNDPGNPRDTQRVTDRYPRGFRRLELVAA